MSAAALSGRRSITLYEVRRGGKCIQGEQEEGGVLFMSGIDIPFFKSDPV